MIVVYGDYNSRKQFVIKKYPYKDRAAIKYFLSIPLIRTNKKAYLNHEIGFCCCFQYNDK